MSLHLQPITLKECYRFIREHHRHHQPPQGGLFAIAVADDKVRGVIVIGRPVARMINDWTAEVTRCCTDGTKNAASMLYGAAWRATKAMGYRRLITYTRCDEAGVSLRAAGWQVVGEVKGASWHRDSRPRVDKSEIVNRLFWEAEPDSTAESR